MIMWYGILMWKWYNDKILMIMWLKVNDDNDNDVNNVKWYNIWWYDEKHIQNKDRDQCWPSTDLKVTKIWIILNIINLHFKVLSPVPPIWTIL